VIRKLGARLGWGLREAAWKADEKVVWPATDAIRYVPSRDGMSAAERESWWVRHGIDLAIAVGLAVVAFLLRRHGIPTDGLWLDDSITGAGLTASPSDLFTVSADHPGFIVTLMGWRDLTGGSDAALTYLALAAGTLGPALLYLGLRWCGYERSISVLMAVVLAVAETHVVYSGRVRTYTIDVLIVLALALVIPRLTQIRWRWSTGVAWIAAGAVLAFWSGFALIAVAVAGAIIVLHPASDLRWRAVAVGVQEAICVALLVAESHTHNLPAQEQNFRGTWDSFVDFSPNPITFGGEAFIHLRRVGEYFVGGQAWFAGLCILVAIVGLAIAAWKGLQAVRARYLLLLLLVAFVAGVLGKFPFGPSQGFLISSGGRVSLWLIPVVAIGLAAALQGLRGALPARGGRAAFDATRRPRPRAAFDAAAYVAAAAILLVAGSRNPVEYPFPGAHSATNFIQSQLSERDAVLLGYRSNWSFATETSLETGVRRTPDSSIGFQPDYSDPRIHYLDVLVDRPHVAPEVGDADRVFVYYAEPPFRSSEAQLRTTLAATLGSLGFDRAPTRSFQSATVEEWARHGVTPIPSQSQRPVLGGANLHTSDLPQGWTLIASQPTPAKQMLACVQALPAGALEDSVVSARGPGGLNVISELDRWPGAAGPQRAAAALSRPAGAACVRSALEATFRNSGLPLSVDVNRARPHAEVGPRGVAYEAIARQESGGAPVAEGSEGSVAFLVRGSTSALVVAFRAGQGPFPRALFSSLTRRIRSQIGAAGG
jgi:hypothetical protein